MSKRILVVEDQPDSRRIIRDMLTCTDYEITEAENGSQGNCSGLKYGIKVNAETACIFSAKTEWLTFDYKSHGGGGDLERILLRCGDDFATANSPKFVSPACTVTGRGR
jgi:hypothetical protein